MQTSPIDIIDSKTIKKEFPQLEIQYHNRASYKIHNDGKTLIIFFDDSVDKRLKISGGPLDNIYIAKETRITWGHDLHTGSEHRVNGNSYVGEFQIIHWNKKYRDFDEASHNTDGIAIISFLLELGNKNIFLDKIIDYIPNVLYANSSVEFKDFNPGYLLPKCTSYWTYNGSNTSKPHMHNVKWIIFKKSVNISAEQINSFRELLSTTNNDVIRRNIYSNFTPVNKTEKYLKVYSDKLECGNSIKIPPIGGLGLIGLGGGTSESSKDNYSYLLIIISVLIILILGLIIYFFYRYINKNISFDNVSYCPNEYKI
ncbi:carbonic anhydrase-like protein [Brazilian porcupinepox virus 1]|nr:carbonic anhydrase-like protein [Brazilian porcupinepox virus 1]